MPAVHDLGSGRTWTFDALAQAGDAADEAGPGTHSGVAFPSGRDVGFLLDVLRAWRQGLPICPLEPGQEPPTIAPPARNIVHLKLTSGSTGAPRLVALTAAQIAADAENIVATMGLSPSSPNLAVISLAHSYGFSNLVTPLLLHGIPLVLVPSPLPAAIAAAADRFPGATLPAVPALWRTWHDAGAIPQSLRLAISAGAPLPLPLEQAVFEGVGVKIHNFIGASECGGIAYDRTTVPRIDASVVGTAMQGVRIGADESGCLRVEGAAVAETYLPEPDPRLGGGRFTSSDLVSIDADGVLRVHGRAADLINVAGRKVAPEAVEEALLSHAAIADCLALGVPDESGRGECVGVAYMLRGESGPVAEAELRAHVARRLPAWQVPRRWWNLPDLGVDARGKRSRPRWREQLLNRPTG